MSSPHVARVREILAQETILRIRHGRSERNENPQPNRARGNAPPCPSPRAGPARRSCGFAQISAFLALACLTSASAAADAYTVMRDGGQFATFCRLIERAQLVEVFRKQVMVNDAFIDIEDIETPIGYLHAIDQVLIPPS